MSLVQASRLDFLWQFQRLLPRGRIWHRGWGTVQAQDLLTLMPTWEALHNRANELITETFPCSTSELLSEWEASLGLPDPCTGELDTLQQRQAAVCAKFRAGGSQSIAYYQEVAAALGYEITIVNQAPFRVNINRVGEPLYGEQWAYAFKIVAPPVTETYFRVGISRVGEPLASWGNELLECTLRALAPAHTIPIFAYIQESLWDEKASIWDGSATHWDYIVPSVAEETGPVRRARAIRRRANRAITATHVGPIR